jgi:hypothetical protein
MNYPRVALGAVAGTIADFAYGFLVYGNLLTGSLLSQTGIYRTAGAQMAYMPYGAAGIFVAMIAAPSRTPAAQARGVPGGITFGALLGLFAIGVAVVRR